MGLLEILGLIVAAVAVAGVVSGLVVWIAVGRVRQARRGRDGKPSVGV